ncbi:MAG: L-seryl-tRNA(Sec) selenium transferase, partial [Candidatus Eisenbacteria bacterium]
MTAEQARLRRIPAVDALLHEPAVAALRERPAHETVVALIREVLAEARLRLLAPGAAGEEPGRGAPAGEGTADEFDRVKLAREVAARGAALLSPRLRRVVNATGILIHTNLGRAPLAPSAQEAVTRVAAGYSSLEMDL